LFPSRLALTPGWGEAGRKHAPRACDQVGSASRSGRGITHEFCGRPKKKNPPDFTKSIPISDFTKSGALGWPDVVLPLYEEINKLYGTDYKPGFK